MHLLSARDTRPSLDNLLDFDTQASARSGVDLTAGTIFAFTEPGRLDFGGSEARPAGREALSAEKQDPGDDYGWWHLDAGNYAVRLNESVELKRGQVALVAPHERLLDAAAHHPVFWLYAPRGVEDPLDLMLTVGPPGLHIKENARLSTLLLFSDRS